MVYQTSSDILRLITCQYEPLDPGVPEAAPREEVGAGRQPRIQQDPVVGQGGKKDSQALERC